MRPSGCFVIAMMSLCMPAFAGEMDRNEAASIWEQGQFYINARYRVESVSQDGFADDALASTLRARAGFQSGEYRGWSGLLEFEDIRVLGIEDFNSTENGKTRFPVVADPPDTELNQLFARYGFKSGSFLKVGRQRINVANQRFIGAVGFRQNEQTFDAATFQLTTGRGLNGTFAYIEQVNRIFGQHHPNPNSARTDVSTGIADIEATWPSLQLAGYLHLFEFDDASTRSHKNIGLRFSTRPPAERKTTVTYYLEYARQTDYKNDPVSFSNNYWHAYLTVKHGFSEIVVGAENLEGDGVFAFQAPFGTLHKFNGDADIFLTTPATGLQDYYLGYRFRHTAFQIGVTGHRFDADTGSIDYGQEWDLFVSKTFNKHLSGKLEYADYSSDTFAQDTRKIWLSLGVKFGT